MYVKVILKNRTPKAGGHILCRYSISKIWIFSGIKYKHNVYKGEDCMNIFLNP